MDSKSVGKISPERLKRMLAPKCAVFIGGQFMAPAIDYCRAIGFQGRIYVVNPRRSEIAGLPCLPDLASLPETSDVAYVAVPSNGVIDVIRELSTLGVGGAICNSAGFAEMQGGKQAQLDLVDAAGDMPVIGPNCPGVANFVDHAAFMMDHFGDHDGSGSVALISNGGAYLSDMGGADRSVGVAYSVGLGNQAMVSVADIMNVILDDDRVRAVNLYIEGIADAAALSRAGLKAARKGIPVVVLKGGGSSAGRRAAQSHTASLAGDDVVTSALFRRLGFIEVRSATEALETLKMLTIAPRIKGRRTGFATSSGSYAVHGSDMAEAYGLIMPPPSAQASTQLEQHLPSFVHPANPLDISSAHNNTPDWNQHINIYRSFLSDDYDLAIQVMCYPAEGGWDPIGWDVTTKAFSQAARERAIPAAFINTLPEDLSRRVRERMIDDGLVPLMGMEDGMRAVANAIRFSELSDVLAGRTDEEIALPELVQGVTEGNALDEAAAKAQLSSSGIAVPQSVVVSRRKTEDLDQLAFPVVAKALSAELAHKSELGAVVLRLTTLEAVVDTIEKMAGALKQNAPQLDVDKFLVEEMVTDGVGELLLGIRRVDPVGLALTIGFGGTEAELLRDTTTIVLPASRSSIAAALRGLKLFPLIDGFRGRAKGDVEAAIDAIVAFAEFAGSNQDRFIEAEINPLIVRPQGRGAVAVDAVMRLA